MCVYVKRFLCWCSSFGMKLVCVEFWSWSTLFWKRCWLSGPEVPGFFQCIQSQSETASQSKFSQMWLPTLWEMWNTIYPRYEDYQWDWWNNDNSSTSKSVFGSFWFAWFATQWSIDESSINANSSWRPRNANINCMFRECITSQDFQVSYHVIFVLYITWCFLFMFIRLKMSMDIFIQYLGWIRKIHQAKNEQYPKFYEGTSQFDYNQAIHVMTCGNSAMVEELHDHFFHSGKRPWWVFKCMN